MGRDFVVSAGGAVHGHPMGPTAGARALRQAIDAVMADAFLRTDSPQHPELQAAVEVSSVSKAGVKGTYDLMEG
jgi:2,3-diketo-5-methylthiopentyl-1-phosphate enolase